MKGCIATTWIAMMVVPKLHQVAFVTLVLIGLKEMALIVQISELNVPNWVVPKHAGKPKVAESAKLVPIISFQMGTELIVSIPENIAKKRYTV